MVDETESTRRLDERLQFLKEGVTAILALAIVGTTLYWMGMAFGMAGQTRMSDAKDVLALMSGLSGVVVGYYFGRVPSEARASQAQRQVAAASEETGRIKSDMATVKGEMDKVRVRPGDSVTMEDFDRIRGMMPPG
jgi:hypothetical protein